MNTRKKFGKICSRIIKEQFKVQLQFLQYMNNCLNLTPNNNTVFWGNNLRNLTIEVQPIVNRPLLTIRQEMIKFGNSSVLNYE